MDFSGGEKLVNQFACEQKLPVNNTHYGGSVIKTGATFNGLFRGGWRACEQKLLVNKIACK